MISRIAARVAFRTLVADDETMAVSLAEEVTELLNGLLPSNYGLSEKGPEMHDSSHGGITFERGCKEFDRAGMNVSLMFVLEYDQSLKSSSPRGPGRGEWAESGGDPAIEGVEVPFTLEVAVFKRKSGRGVTKENRRELGTGLVLVTDAMENVTVQFDSPELIRDGLTGFVDYIIANEPVAADEKPAGRVRERL
jgi:hypothetical protein